MVRHRRQVEGFLCFHQGKIAEIERKHTYLELTRCLILSECNSSTVPPPECLRAARLRYRYVASVRVNTMMMECYLHTHVVVLEYSICNRNLDVSQLIHYCTGVLEDYILVA